MPEMNEALKQHLKPDELALLELSRKATPGPWKTIKPGHGHETKYLSIQYGKDEMYTSLELLPGDARITCESRNMLEPLLQRLAESRAEVERLQSEINRKNQLIAALTNGEPIQIWSDA